jgi:hypothetical protein
MRQNDVARCERRRHLCYNFQKSIIVGHKNLNVIAHLSELGGGTHEIWNWLRSSVPHEDMKAFMAQDFCYSAADDTEANDSDILSRSMRHVRSVAPCDK